MSETITKAAILKVVEDLPENATVEDAIERLVFLHKIQVGIEQTENGETVSLDDFEAYFRRRRADKSKE